MKHMSHLIGLVALALATIVGGCTSTNSLPSGAKKVGGGLRITWWAPTDGTAILVETTTGKTVATETLTQGGPQFSFDVDSQRDAETLKLLFPSMPTNANFVLYFVPSQKKE